MPQFSKTLLPPILDYYYPAFRYEDDNKGNVKVSLPAMLSITNTIDQVDHAQIRIVSLNTNKNALNPNIFTQNIYFVSMTNAKDLTININTVINGLNIFKTTTEEIYPSYYKMQIRLGIKSDNNYNPSWGQNVSKDWLTKNAENFSEWSNSGILKTVEKPQFGIFTLDKDIENIITNSNYLWKGFYVINDSNESLKKYHFELEDANHNIIERGEDTYIGEYESPSLSYKFNQIFVHDNIYYLKIYIESTTGYKDSISYKLKTQFSFVKIYNIFKVVENEDDAHNLIDISARQIQLKSTNKISGLSWLSDPAMNTFGEYGITHYNITNGILETNDDFNIPYNSFSIIFSTTNFINKIKSFTSDCFINDNFLMHFGQSGSYGTDFYLGALKQNNKYYFILKEEFKMDTKNNFVQYYKIESPVEIVKNKEFIFIIKKDKGETIFELHKWLDNKL